MTTFTVSNTANVVDGNSGQGQLSLRETMNLGGATTPADTIKFTASVRGHTLSKSSQACRGAQPTRCDARFHPHLAACALAAVGLATWLPAGPVLADIGFVHEQVDANGPPRVWGKGAGDLDGDGKVDLVVGSNTGGLYWYRNPEWTKQKISTARMEEDMAVVDLNGDGRRDIVAPTNNGVGGFRVTWFQNTGAGWVEHTLFNTKDLHDIEVVDLDGDGKRDIVARNQNTTGNVLYFWRRVSLTSWTPKQIALPEGGEGLLAVDFNRDQKVDVAIGKYWFKNLSTPGTLTFQRYTYSLGAENNAYIAAGNINQSDNYRDLVVTPSEPKGGKGDVAWYQAPQKPALPWIKHTIEVGVESARHFVGVADFDRDGDMDVATAMTHVGTNPRIEIYYNTDGNGSFGLPLVVANTSSHSMKIVDLDNNGLKSLFGADYGNKTTTPINLWRAVVLP